MAIRAKIMELLVQLIGHQEAFEFERNLERRACRSLGTAEYSASYAGKADLDRFGGRTGGILLTDLGNTHRSCQIQITVSTL